MEDFSKAHLIKTRLEGSSEVALLRHPCVQCTGEKISMKIYPDKKK